MAEPTPETAVKATTAITATMERREPLSLRLHVEDLGAATVIPWAQPGYTGGTT